MKYYIYGIFAAISIGCGFNGNQNVNIPNTAHVITGETYSYVILRLEFLNTIQTLCQDLFFDEENQVLRKKLVAECTFERLELLNIDVDALGQFDQTFCNTNTDLSQLTEQERIEVEQACNLIGGL